MVLVIVLSVQEVRAALAKRGVLGGSWQGRTDGQLLALPGEMARACKISAGKGLGSAGKMAGCEETWGGGG